MSITFDIVDEFDWRGMIYQTTAEKEVLRKRLLAKPVTVYCGFDPTADSLGIGNLLGLMALRRFQQAGHKVIALIGGGTGFIGDPSGKSDERSLLTPEQLDKNIEGVRAVMMRFLDFEGDNAALLLNNADWLKPLSLIEFLRDTCKHFSVNAMIEKESVRARLQDRDHGISFTEFSYMLLQAYDFQYLYDQNGCNMQVGGSDQWGNITAGTDLIRRNNVKRGVDMEDAKQVEENAAFGLTWPLIKRSDGVKMGKTEGGNIWLSADKTSPWDFYQYLVRITDEDAIPFLKYFTELSKEEIENLEQQMKKDPAARIAQKTLASWATELVHGKEEREKAEETAKRLFPAGGKASSDIKKLSEEELLTVVENAPSGAFEKSKLEGEGLSFIEVMIETSLWKSKGEARKSIQQNGANLNNERVTDIAAKVTANDLLHDKYLVLRKGKKNYFLLKCE